MPQPTVEEIRQLTDEWGELQLKVDKLVEGCAAVIEPVTETYNMQVEDITRRYDKKIGKLLERQNEIWSIVGGVLDRKKKDYSVEGEIAVAERKTETKIGPRVINFLKFWRKAKPLGQAGIDCINVQVGAAEKLMGKKAIDAISTKKETIETVVRIRLKEDAKREAA